MNLWTFINPILGGQPTRLPAAALPVEGQPGEWFSLTRPDSGEVGVRLYRREDLLHHLGAVLYRAEGRGEPLEDGGGFLLYPEARLLAIEPAWSPAVAASWAVDCAERTLPHLEAALPGEERPRRALEIARRGLQVETPTALVVSAGDAVIRATREHHKTRHLFAPAREAVVTVVAARTGMAPAWECAQHTAEVSRWVAADQASQDSEFEWQTQRFLEYLEWNPTPLPLFA